MLGVLAAVGCVQDAVDLGNSGTIFASTAPPTEPLSSPTNRPFRLVDNEPLIVGLSAQRGRLFWSAGAWDDSKPTDIIRALAWVALRHCEVRYCAKTVKAPQTSGLPPIPGMESLARDIWNDGSNFYWTWSTPTDTPSLGTATVAGCLVEDCKPSRVFLTMGNGLESWRRGDGFHFTISRNRLLRCHTAECIDTAEELELVPPAGEAQLYADYDGFVYADGYIYLTDGTRIARLTASGDGAFEVLYRGHVDEVRALAVHGDRLYWSEGFAKEYGSVKCCPTTGCADPPTLVMPTRQAADYVAVDDAHVYAVETDTPQNRYYDSQPEGFAECDRLLRCPTTGCSEPTVLVQDAGIVGPLEQDNQYVYFVGGNVEPDPAIRMQTMWQSNYIAAVAK